MKVNQISLNENNWSHGLASITVDPNLILLFVSPDFTLKQQVLSQLNRDYPKSTIIGCSTAGEISDVTVKDKSISLTAIQFNKTCLKLVSVKVDQMEYSQKAGEKIGIMLNQDGLKHVMVLSDGLNINGADLVMGLKSNLPNISITGGLAADGEDFGNTFVIRNNEMLEKTVLALGFYGDSLKVNYSSKGGWDGFGIERLVTKADKNVLYELDGKPALKIYKHLLGEDAKKLPSSGLLFPVSMRQGGSAIAVVRGISGISEDDQSLVFGANIPEGAYLRLMKGNIDKLITGAEESAISVSQGVKETLELVILISCIGRRLVLKQLVEEEIDVVRHIVGDNPKITGFYSYGEIAPLSESLCELHHQTMTITTLSEC
ncbi:FIST signal transduction protein [Algibacter sp. L4_22]|uniref:FIST signal transduction protein n=1 Tax=Algibacter sp. L4_22 TaxID=2942477 RepID=UPI00201B943E|nr:FIST N-terminal domain-containing protein [Algibacter sp. L4_22]MCL5129089.1 FIST C-terminal domain-containing protein [Algibacter sp. L4_22]